MTSARPKLPPYSIEAEQSVLGGLMLDNRAWNELADRLAAEDFYREDHQLIYRAISELVGANRPCDFVTLSEHLKNQGRLDEAGGLAYLGTLANDTPSAANVLAYAEIVRERAVLRGLIRVGGDVADLGYRPEGRSPEELLDAAERAVLQVRAHREKAGSGPAGMVELVEHAEHAVITRNPGNGVAGLSSGLVDLDAKTTGFHSGDLVIVAGRPGMGKSMLTVGFAEHCAATTGPALVFSMEMPTQQLIERMISGRTEIPFESIRHGTLTQVERDRVTTASGDLRKLPLWIDETPALSPNALRSRARRIKAKHGLRLIVVDYIQLMQVPGTKDNRTGEIAEVSRSLKALAKELEVPVIGLSQLNREVERRDDKRPRMADLRESGGIEQDADLIVFIYRDEVYNPGGGYSGTAELLIRKQRNGPLGDIRVAARLDVCRFDNLAPGWQPPEEQRPAHRPRGFSAKQLGASHAAHSAID